MGRNINNKAEFAIMDNYILQFLKFKGVIFTVKVWLKSSM